MPIDLYSVPYYSPPCRAILMVAAALNLDLNIKLVNMSQGEHLTPEYLKINPQHTVPTLVDDGFALWESRAIISYLVNKYGNGSSLYPEEPRARALVDQRLYFDMGTLYQSFMDFIAPQVNPHFKGPADDAKLKKVEEALGFLEKFLEGHQYVAGDTLTLADYSIVATVSSFSVFGIDAFKYPNIKVWYERVRTTAPGYYKNEEGVKIFEKVVQEMMKKKLS